MDIKVKKIERKCELKGEILCKNTYVLGKMTLGLFFNVISFQFFFFLQTYPCSGACLKKAIKKTLQTFFIWGSSMLKAMV